METRNTKLIRRFFALLLCVAMLLPMIAVPGAAAELTDPAAGASGAESTEAEGSAEDAELVPSLLSSRASITIPSYSGGRTSDTLVYDGGNGISKDGAKSYLTIVTGTDSSEFVSYKSTLANAGYQLVSEKEVASGYAGDPNRFASYLSADGTYKLYTYHLPYYGETRIIVDTQADTVEGYSYTPQAGVSVEPKLVMWGLSSSYTGYHMDTSVSGGNMGQQANTMRRLFHLFRHKERPFHGNIKHYIMRGAQKSRDKLCFC